MAYRVISGLEPVCKSSCLHLTAAISITHATILQNHAYVSLILGWHWAARIPSSSPHFALYILNNS